MKTTVAKWGNSLALRIPAAFAREIDAVEGSEMELSVLRGRLIVAPARRTYALEDLIDGITAENLHQEIEWGKPRGGEVW
jgi:antitoxin MazE